LRQTSVEDKLQREISVIAARRIKAPLQVTPRAGVTRKLVETLIQHGIKFPVVTMPRLPIAMTDSHRRVSISGNKSLDESRGSAICSSLGQSDKFCATTAEAQALGK